MGRGLLENIGLFCRALLQKTPMILLPLKYPSLLEFQIRSSGKNILFLIHVFFRGYYGVATISRLLKIIGLFCKRALQKRRIFFKETCNFKEPTDRSHPITLILEYQSNTQVRRMREDTSPLAFSLEDQR